MPYSAAAEAQMLDSLNGGTPASVIAYASLHTAYSATGANEVTGGAPAYARQAVTWNAASGGSKTSASVAGTFPVPGGITVAFIGLWSALSGGTFAGMGPNQAGTQYAFTATSGNPGVFTAPGAPFAANQSVVCFAGAGATLPGGISEGAVYYVVPVSGSTFSLSATSGGTGVATSSAGAGIVQAITLETYGGQGTFALNAETLSLF